MKFYHYFLVFALILLQNKMTFMKKATKGPFKVTPLSEKDCVKTTLPRRKPSFGPVDSFYMEIYNSSKKANLMRGNFSLTQGGRGFTIKSNAYMWQNGKWKLHISMPSLDCSSPIITFLLKLTNFRYNTANCEYQKGTYWFSSVDLNMVEHLWASEREYGRVLWRTEMVSQYNTLLCVAIETLVEPQSNNPKNDKAKLLSPK